MADSFTGYTNLAMPQTSLADMMNMASGVQQYQQAQQMNPLALQQRQLELKKAQETYGADVAQRLAESQRAQTEANVAAGTAQPRISAATSEADIKRIQSLKEFQSNAARQLLGLATKKDLTSQDIEDSITKTLKDSGAGDNAIKQSTAQIPKSGTPAELQLWVGRNGLQSLEAAAHIDKLYPAAQIVSTGAANVPTTGGSYLSVQQPGQQINPGVERQLPPETTVAGPTGETTYLGSLSQRQGGPVKAGVGPATTNLQTKLGETLGTDWTATSQKASEAPQKIALYQNIKKLIPESYTGALADKKQFVANLAQSVGIPYSELESASTDELAKNTKLLQLAGGNTDAARGLAELASPNTKMTKEGMLRVTNQLIGQEQFNAAKANFLQGATGDPSAYQNKLLQWQNAADPRFFQEMSQADAQKMMQAMSPAELAALRKKRAFAKQLGIIQ
jgi:hypothetical protein